MFYVKDLTGKIFDETFDTPEAAWVFVKENSIKGICPVHRSTKEHSDRLTVEDIEKTMAVLRSPTP